MAGLLDWLNDSGIFGGGGGTGAAPMVAATNGYQGPGGAPDMGPQPPVQVNGAPPLDPSADGNPAAGFGGAASPQPSVPLPQPRPPGAPTAQAEAPQQNVPPGMMPGAPMDTTPVHAMPGMSGAPAQGPNPANMPGQTWLGRAFGITPDQAAVQGRQITSGLAAGLKAIGSGAGLGQGKFAAFAGGMGNAMEGAQKEANNQQKQMSDYLNAAIKAKQSGDEAGYKRSYLKYLAAKLQADTDKAASGNASNKNDTPTQLYLSAERLVQADPEVRDASKALGEARKNGSPDDVAKAQASLQQIIQAKQAQHYGALGLNPQTAAQIGKQPGNSQANPIDAGKMGITKDNIAKKLQPGQYFTNPSDGKVYQYKGPAESSSSKKSSGGIPDKPTAPEPVDPTKPYKTPAQGDSDDED